MSKEKKSLLEQIASGMRIAGALGLFGFGISCLEENSNVQRRLVEGNRILAQRAYEQKESYQVCL